MFVNFVVTTVIHNECILFFNSWGRRPLFIFTASFYLITSLIPSFMPTYTLVIFSRFLVGLSVYILYIVANCLGK